MDYAKIELVLRRAIEQRLTEGWFVHPGQWVYEGECCAIGALVTDRAGTGNPMFSGTLKNFVRDRLPISNEDLLAISDGFEGSSPMSDGPRLSSLYEIGKRLRRDYYETTDDVVA